MRPQAGTIFKGNSSPADIWVTKDCEGVRHTDVISWPGTLSGSSVEAFCLSESNVTILLFFQWCANLRRFWNLRWPSVWMSLGRAGPACPVLSPRWRSAWRVRVPPSWARGEALCCPRQGTPNRTAEAVRRKYTFSQTFGKSVDSPSVHANPKFTSELMMHLLHTESSAMLSVREQKWWTWVPCRVIYLGQERYLSVPMSRPERGSNSFPIYWSRMFTRVIL